MSTEQEKFSLIKERIEKTFSAKLETLGYLPEKETRESDSFFFHFLNSAGKRRLSLHFFFRDEASASPRWRHEDTFDLFLSRPHKLNPAWKEIPRGMAFADEEMWISQFCTDHNHSKLNQVKSNSNPAREFAAFVDLYFQELELAVFTYLKEFLTGEKWVPARDPRDQY